MSPKELKKNPAMGTAEYLAALVQNEKSYMLFKEHSALKLTSSPVTGKQIEGTSVTLSTLSGEKESLDKCSNFHFSEINGQKILTYLKDYVSGKQLQIATGARLDNFQVVSSVSSIWSNSILTPNFRFGKYYVLFYGERSVQIGFSSDLLNWHLTGSLIVSPRSDFFDHSPLSVMGAFLTEAGIVLIYDASFLNYSGAYLQCGAAILSMNDPHTLLWKSEIPLFEYALHEPGVKIFPLAVNCIGNQLSLFWKTSKGDLLTTTFDNPFLRAASSNFYFHLERHYDNPIIKPTHENSWESFGTFNPGAVLDEDDTVHLFYRAIGNDGVSRVGHATSQHGFEISKRSREPVFNPASGGFGLGLKKKRFNPKIYTSGGSGRGVEDPKVVRINNKIYMTYVAFEGWDSVRIGLTSIDSEDLKNGDWDWAQPRLISKPGEINKNWVIFPEKIGGKYAILTGIAPEIYVTYVDSLDAFDGFITSPRPQGVQPGRSGFWDNRVRGAGPPPIRTDLGWLLFYHAEDQHDPGKYKLGAMILDASDPTKVLHRSNSPVLTPVMHYENDWKPGVVYASGAVVKGNRLLVYYGGGDKVVAVASAHFPSFLQKLAQSESPQVNFDQSIHHMAVRQER